MYSLHLTCLPGEVDLLSADLWEFGTAGIRELDSADKTVLIAGFEANQRRAELFQRFANYSPEWEQEDTTDWVRHTEQSWPAREIGEKIFLAPVWSNDSTPSGRVRVVHNPGLACGTGEHPCTQLAFAAIERYVQPGSRMVDVGTGSGILAIAALRLGAELAVGIDPDVSALQAAHENFALNGIDPTLVAGFVDCVTGGCSDLTLANISGSVLLSIFDDLLRITSPGGRLILTGFNESEVRVFLRLLPTAEVSALNEWRCVTATIS
ncbi:MAG: 50S ribosomal protein L11 methyltransferase [Acidobacteriota bacterium]|nr:50S ribosomal protein L11 methyltransferase [Acidobacteriota bacterium]